MGRIAHEAQLVGQLDELIRIIECRREGDYVVVSVVQELPDPKNPGKTYTTNHLDMWRMKGGKADEHWDGAALGPPIGPPSSAP